MEGLPPLSLPQSEPDPPDDGVYNLWKQRGASVYGPQRSRAIHGITMLLAVFIVKTMDRFVSIDIYACGLKTGIWLKICTTLMTMALF